MPISSRWLYDNRVIVQKHYGVITGKQLTEAINEIQSMVSQGTPPVHIFIDASEENSQSEIGLGDLKALIPKAVDGLGWTVAVQPKALQRFFTSLGMQLSGAKYKFVNSEREAVEFLLEHDPTLREVIR